MGGGSYLVAIMGARGHYGVARTLQHSGILDRFHTDSYAYPFMREAAERASKLLSNPLLKKFAGRSARDLPTQKVVAHQMFGLVCGVKRALIRNTQDKNRQLIWSAKCFSSHVARYGLGDADTLYAVNTESLELLRTAKQHGLKVVLEQMSAPKSIEIQILKNEARLFPWLASKSELGWEPIAERESQEWSLADLILCPSDFVQAEIRKANGPFLRTRLVPYGVQINKSLPFRRPPKHGPLKVLFAGRVGIQKGAHRLILAAKELADEDFQFRLVGFVDLPDSVLKRLPPNLELFGPTPRSEMSNHYHWGDALCLPSLCEGSATVTYEAMAFGMPVVCTSNAGSLVQDGIDGFLIDDREPVQSIVQALRRLRTEGEQLKGVRVTSSKDRMYSFPAYEKRLLLTLAELAQ